MPHRRALPEGVPPEGLKVLRCNSEEELEQRFATLANEGYVPAGDLEVGTHFDEKNHTWNVIYVLPLWQVGGGSDDRDAYS